jgi:hypothetical protein
MGDVPYLCPLGSNETLTKLGERATLSAMRVSPMPTNDKLTAATHYLIARFSPSQLGATKLNKVLWFADCEFFRRHGRTITGQSFYVRKPNGPCVDGFDRIIADLKTSGKIAEEQVQTYIGHPRREFRAHLPPEVDAFTAEEIDVLIEVGREIARLSAQEASDLSHDDLWTETLPNGRIPVAAGAVEVVSLSETDDPDWGRRAFA